MCALVHLLYSRPFAGRCARVPSVHVRLSQPSSHSRWKTLQTHVLRGDGSGRGLTRDQAFGSLPWEGTVSVVRASLVSALTVVAPVFATLVISMARVGTLYAEWAALNIAGVGTLYTEWAGPGNPSQPVLRTVAGR